MKSWTDADDPSSANAFGHESLSREATTHADEGLHTDDAFAGVLVVCNATKAKKLIGQKRSAGAEALALRLSGAGSVRWIPIGTMVTMDYRPDRLNLRLDRKGRILSMSCG